MRLGRLRQGLGLAVSILLLIGALWILERELHHYHIHDIISAAKQISGGRIAWAAAFAFFSYLVLTAYDWLGFVYLRRSLAYPRIALTAFLGYAFSHNLGFPLLTGSAVRYRLYSIWGLGVVDVAKIIALGGITFWLGFAALSGVAFLFAPPELPAAAHLGRYVIRGIGLVFLLLLVGYLVWNLRSRVLRVRGWEFPTPPLRLTLLQVGVSCADWCCTAAVLYALLPASSLSVGGYLTLFLLAQIVGLISHVPGGLGVFESAILLLFRDYMPTPDLMGALLLYRILYYLAPFSLAIVLLGFTEAARKRAALARLTHYWGEWVAPAVPQLFAYAMFGGGAILLLSGATPTAHSRMPWLRDLLPLPIVEISHFLGSLAGAALLLVARGLQRRVDVAYGLTLGLLATGIVASILKGFDYEEALILTLMLAALLPCRRHFYRKAALLRLRFTPAWMTAILLIAAGSVWLGFFSYKHVEYTQDLWWHFSFSGDASRFLRASVGMAALLAWIGFAQLLRPAPPEPVLPSPEEIERAAAIVAHAPDTRANLALLGDKRLLFNADADAFLMYGVQGRSWIALGDPVGAAEERQELAWRFLELSDRHGGWTVVHHVPPASLPLYVQMGLAPVKLGENARVALTDFSLEGRSRKEFRQMEHKYEREGCTFEVLPPDRVEALLPRLRVISDAWLADKHTREKRFGLGFFDERYLTRGPLATVRRGDELLAFANVWCGANKQELSIDLMRYLPETPHGVMDFLFSQLMLWGRAEGYQWFDLGMAPLSGLENHPLAPLWNRLGNLIYRYGDYFFNYQGLREYKDKFNPVWEPRYLIYPGGLILANVLLDLATLISGGVRGIVSR